jgi:hypothetical protein
MCITSHWPDLVLILSGEGKLGLLHQIRILQCTKMLGQGLIKGSFVLSFKGCEKDINNLIKNILSRADSECVIIA